MIIICPVSIILFETSFHHCIYSNDDSFFNLFNLYIFFSFYIGRETQRPTNTKHSHPTSLLWHFFLFSYRNKIYSPLVRVLAMCIRCENVPDDDEEKNVRNFRFQSDKLLSLNFFLLLFHLICFFSHLKLCMLKCASCASHSMKWSWSFVRKCQDQLLFPSYIRKIVSLESY